MKDGRIILHVTENDGSPITTHTYSSHQATVLFLTWAKAIMKEQNTNTLVVDLEPEQKELVIQLRDMKKEVEPKKAENNQ